MNNNILICLRYTGVMFIGSRVFMTSQKYLDMLKDFRLIVTIASHLDKALSSCTNEISNSDFLGHIFFSRMVSFGKSLLELLPQNESDLKLCNYKILYFPSIASVTRSLIESYDILFYLNNFDEVNDTEFEYRNLRFNLHGNLEKYALLKKLGYLDTQSESRLNDTISTLKNQISKNSFFIQLTPDEQKKTQNSKPNNELNLFYISRNDRVEKLLIKLLAKVGSQKIEANIEQGIDKFMGMYKFLSGFAHTSPIYLDDYIFKNGADSDFVLLTIHTGIFYISVAIDNIAETLPALDYKIDESDKEVLGKVVGKYLQKLGILK